MRNNYILKSEERNIQELDATRQSSALFICFLALLQQEQPSKTHLHTFATMLLCLLAYRPCSATNCGKWTHCFSSTFSRFSRCTSAPELAYSPSRAVHVCSWRLSLWERSGSIISPNVIVHFSRAKGENLTPAVTKTSKTLLPKPLFHRWIVLQQRALRSSSSSKAQFPLITLSQHILLSEVKGGEKVSVLCLTNRFI